MQKWIIVVFSVAALVAGISFYQSQQYDFETIDGESHKWQAMQGQWVVVNYFAEWCAPCLKEVPELNAFYHQSTNSENVTLFAVSYDPLPATKLIEIRDKYNMKFPLLNPEKTKYIPIDKPQYLPATYVIDPSGNISKPLLGEQTSASLMQAVNQLKQTF